jgi:type III restriction enzyme
LTVTANESYEQFANSLQKEIAEETGVSFQGRIKDKRERQKVVLKKSWQLDQNFLNLWERISHQTDYQVNYDTQELIESASKSIAEMATIPKPILQRVKTATIFERDDQDQLVGVGGVVKGSKSTTLENIRFEIPDFVSYIQSKTELTRDTISKILLKSGKLSQIFHNPQIFMDTVVKLIRVEFDRLKVNGIKYEKIAGKTYKMELFESNEIDSYLSKMIAVQNQDKTLLSHIVYDSGVELDFAKECESRDDVLFYIKLPAWFKIKTPIGNYNPDWALIKQEENEALKVYFVAETKDTADLKELEQKKPLEAMKIKCGIKHFENFDDVSFKQVKTVGQL